MQNPPGVGSQPLDYEQLYNNYLASRGLKRSALTSSQFVQLNTSYLQKQPPVQDGPVTLEQLKRDAIFLKNSLTDAINIILMQQTEIIRLKEQQLSLQMENQRLLEANQHQTATIDSMHQQAFQTGLQLEQYKFDSEDLQQTVDVLSAKNTGSAPGTTCQKYKHLFPELRTEFQNQKPQ